MVALGQHRPWVPIRAALPAVGQCTRVFIVSRATLPDLNPWLLAGLNRVLRRQLHHRPKLGDKEYVRIFLDFSYIQ